MNDTPTDSAEVTDGRLPARTCSALWGDALRDIKQSMADAIEEIEATMECVPWDEDYNEIGMSRRDGKPEIGLTLFNDNIETIARFSSSFDEFLDETECIYSCGDDGWGVRMIEDLELLKVKIQERIDRMNAEIEAEIEAENSEQNA